MLDPLLLVGLPLLLVGPGFAWARVLLPRLDLLAQFAVAIPLSLALMTLSLAMLLQVPGLHLDALLAWSTGASLAAGGFVASAKQRRKRPGPTVRLR